MITIKAIKSKKEMKQFVAFPFSLYKNNKFWVPPIIKDELAGFDKNKNPAFKNANAQFFLAYKNNKIVGRVVAIINYIEINEQQIKKMRFGWLDFIDDIKVSKALFNKVYEIGKKNKLKFIEGPVGFSGMDKVGVLTKGFDKIGTMISWYNHSYYEDHYKNFGFKAEKEFLESIILIKNIDIKKYRKFSKLIQKRYQLKSLNFNKTNEILPYVDKMFALYNQVYSKLVSFVPISNEQINQFKKKYVPFVNPEYIKFVLNKNNEIIAFAIIMPAFAKALQKANGKLFPLGIFNLLKAKKKNDTAVSYLIGVSPEFQNKGVTAIVFDSLYASVLKNKITYLRLTPQLKSNIEIHKLWKNFKPKAIKERTTFRLNITE